MAQAQSAGADVRIFLMNHAVCLAHERLKGQQECELQKMLLEAISRGAEIKVCKTFITRCDAGYVRLVYQFIRASMSELLGWLDDSDRVLVS
jgi:sulfur relay (sulfurtransferase) complex TusBCD TusD component (DsrE family)